MPEGDAATRCYWAVKVATSWAEHRQVRRDVNGYPRVGEVALRERLSRVASPGIRAVLGGYMEARRYMIKTWRDAAPRLFHMAAPAAARKGASSSRMAINGAAGISHALVAIVAYARDR